MHVLHSPIHRQSPGQGCNIRWGPQNVRRMSILCFFFFLGWGTGYRKAGLSPDLSESAELCVKTCNPILEKDRHWLILRFKKV